MPKLWQGVKGHEPSKKGRGHAQRVNGHVGVLYISTN